MDAIQLVVAAVARATISTFPLFVLVAAITLLGRRWLAPWSRQMLWSLVLVRLMLPVSFESTWSLQPGVAKEIELSIDKVDSIASSEGTHFVAPVAEAHVLGVTEADAHRAIAQAYPAPVAKVDVEASVFEAALLIAILTGTLIVGIWTVVTSVRLWRWTRKGAPCDREDLRSLVSEGQRRLGVSGTIRLWKVPGLAGPATYGWWNPTILLPDDVETWSLQERKHVIWHELAHIRRYDVLQNWGLALVRIVHWWNPMFWMAQRAWLAERELACDALVLAHLEDQGVRQYGETLLKFIERLATMGNWPSLAAPGFVSFWGRKHEAKRRLSQLAKLAQPERTWCVWLSMALIAVLMLVGLSDAASRSELPVKLGPLELPVATTWNMAPVARANGLDEPRTTVDYDLAQVIDRLCHDDGLGRDMATLSTYQLIKTIGQVDPAKHWSCALQGETLQVQGSTRAHAEVQQLLELWRTRGQNQICNEIRIGSTSLSLADLLPTARGQVVGGEESTFEHSGLAAQAKTSSNSPLFQAVLTDEETKNLVGRLQQDARSNIMLAPKITTFNGQTARFMSLTARPFITGIRDVGEGAHQPHVSVLDDGVTIQVRSATTADDKSIQMDIAYEESHIDDVEVLETKNGEQQKAIQIPHVSRSRVSVTENIPTGHTLLLVPLRRNEQGQLQLHLFRSELIPSEAVRDAIAPKHP